MAAASTAGTRRADTHRRWGQHRSASVVGSGRLRPPGHPGRSGLREVIDHDTGHLGPGVNGSGGFSCTSAPAQQIVGVKAHARRRSRAVVGRRARRCAPAPVPGPAPCSHQPAPNLDFAGQRSSAWAAPSNKPEPVGECPLTPIVRTPRPRSPHRARTSCCTHVPRLGRVEVVDRPRRGADPELALPDPWFHSGPEIPEPPHREGHDRLELDAFGRPSHGCSSMLARRSCVRFPVDLVADIA